MDGIINSRERVLELAGREVERRHESVAPVGRRTVIEGDGAYTGRHGFDFATCKHPDCVLVRSALPASVEGSTDRPTDQSLMTRAVQMAEHLIAPHKPPNGSDVRFIYEQLQHVRRYAGMSAASVEGREQALKSVQSLDGKLLARFYDYDYFDSVMKALATLQEAGAAPASAEQEIEERTIEDVRAHWFLQGGKAQFGMIPVCRNADEVISAILDVVRLKRPTIESSAPLVSPQGEE